MSLVLNHQTAAQFVARFRAAYQVANKDRVCMLAKFVLNHIASGDITDAQVRNAFGLTTTQYNTLKTKMQNFVANYDAVQAAAGE